MKPASTQYTNLHTWVKRQLGRPRSCEVCGAQDRAIDWANISGEYQRDTSDYAALCKPCHRNFDGHIGFRSVMCKRGHIKKGDNVQVFWRKGSRPSPEYACRKCVTLRNLMRSKKWQTIHG